MKVNGEQAVNSVQSVQKEMEQLREQMIQLEDAGKENTSQYAEVKKQFQETMKAANEMYAAEKAASDAKQKFSENILEAYSNTKKELTEVTKQVQALRKAGMEGSQEFEKLSAKQKNLLETNNKYYQAIQNGEAQIQRLQENGGKSLSKLEAEYRQIMLVLKQLPPEHKDFNDYIDALKSKKAAIDEIKNSFKDVKDEVSGAGQELNKGNDNIVEMGDLLTGGLITGGLLAAAGAALELGTAIAEDVEAMRELRNEIQLLTGQEGAELDQTTIKIQALSQTYTEDQTELLRSANALSKEFGITTAQSLDLIEQGFLAGGNAGGDLLSTIQEYAVQFKAAGTSADEFIAVSSQATKAGIFSDKGVDTVKEFGLRIREQTKATNDAMVEAFGRDFTEKIFKGINDGSLSSVDALKMISTEMGNTEIPANKLQTVIADVFGAAGEDGGQKYIETLSTVKTSTSELINTDSEAVKQKMELQAANEGLATAQNELTKELSGASAAWDSMKSTGGELIARVLLVIVKVFGLVKDAVVGVVEGFPPLRFTFEMMGKVASGLYEVLLLIPAVLDGISAAAAYAAAPIRSFFLDIEIGFQKAKKMLPFADEAAINTQIQQLEAAKAALVPQYQSIGEAFGAAYNQGIANGRTKTTSGTLKTGGGGGGGGNKPTNKFKGESAKAGKEVAQRSAFDVIGEESIDEQMERELGAFKAVEDKRVAAVDDAERRIYEIKEKQAENLRKLDADQLASEQKSAEARLALENARLDAAKFVFSGLSQLLSGDEQARKKHQAAIKALALAEIVINLRKELSAIAAASAANPSNALTFGAAGITQYSIQSGIAIARAALSTASLLKYEKGGIAKGPSHAQNGIKMVDGQTGSIVGEMEGGEPYMILSRDTYGNNKGVVDALLYSSMYRGGAPIYATGGIFNTAPTMGSSASLSSGDSSALVRMLLAEQRATRQAIEAMPVVIRAEVKYQDIEDAGNTLADIRGKANL